MNILSFDVGIKNLAYCIINEETNNIVAWDVFEIPTILKYQIAIMNTNELWNHTFHKVIIEKQPPTNPKMRIIENMLNIYFIMKEIPDVCTYSAKHKLGELGKTTRGQKNYNVRKKYGVAMTNVYLQDSRFLTFFNSHKKKDDLSDCLLQALAYNSFDMSKLQTTICTM
jgi:hypothetical protein